MKQEKQISQEQIESVITETERVMEHTGQIGKVNGLRFECLYCPAVFAQFKDLVEHWEIYHKDGNK